MIITFEISELSKAEVLDPSWTDPQLLCSRKGASVKGGIGPFGLLVLASKGLQEYTAVFYRVFKSHSKFVVLMCSDQSRSLSLSLSLSLLPNFKLFFLTHFFGSYWVLIVDRSSFNHENDETTYGAFVDVDPVHEKLSLRSLVSCYI